MPVLYKLYQDNRKNSKNVGKWYARAVHNGTVDLMALATIMQRNCTVKRSDILAVLTELVEVMQDQLQSSMRVKLDGFGSFKIGLKTTPADSVDKFLSNKNVAGLRINFQPEVKIDRHTPHPYADFPHWYQSAGGCEERCDW
jgi:predicted histone-like DNA-binding protein